MSNAEQISHNITKAMNVDIPHAIERGLSSACMIVVADAKGRAPVDTGMLRSSIQSKVSGNMGVIGSSVEYAPYVEIGTGIYSTQGNGRQSGWVYVDAKGEGHFTRGSKPQAFLKPAVDSNVSRILKCFEGLI